MTSRKRSMLSISEKVKCIRLSDKGISLRKIAEKMKVGKSQIGNILSRKEEILKTFSSGEISSSRQKITAKRQAYPEVNEKTWLWFQSARAKNIPITGRMIQEKAMMIAKELDLTQFTASNGWLYSFQQRHSISQAVLSGESGEVPQEMVTDWTNHLSELCVGYEPKDIYNCDESGIFFRTLPSKSLVAKTENTKGIKLSKERFTVLLAASATGHKINPLIIGKSANPRSLPMKRRLQFHIDYAHNRRAWMTTAIFENWFQKLNNRMEFENRRILLFLDNCSAHPKLSLSNIKLIFLPPNTTSKLQPLDAGIIQNLKLLYRQKLMRYVLCQIDSVSAVSEIAKSVSLLQAVTWISQSWRSIEASTIQKCFQKCGFEVQPDRMDSVEEETTIDLDSFRPLLEPDVTIDHVINFDQNVRTIDISCDARDPDSDSESESEIDDDNQKPLKPWSECQDHLTDLMNRAMDSNDSESIDMIQKLQERFRFLQLKQATVSKQTRIDDFFKQC